MTATPAAGHSGIRDTTTVLVMRLLSILVAVAVQSLLARLLAPEGRGALGVCLSYASILATFFICGTDRATQYYVISGRNSISAGMTLAVLLGASSSCVAALVGWFLVETPLEFFQKADASAFRFSLLVIPAVTIMTALNLLLVARRRFFQDGLASLATSAVNVVGVGLLVGALDMNVRGALLSLCLANAASAAYGFWVLRTYEAARFVRVSPADCRKVLAYGVRFLPARFGTTINAQLPTVLLAWVAMEEEIGWYVAAAALMERFFMLPNALNQAIQPRIGASSEGRPELVARSVRVLLVMLVLALAAVVLPSRWIVPALFTSAFDRSVVLLWILAVGVLLRGATRPIVAYFIGVGRPAVTSACSILQLAVLVPLVPVLYGRYGVEGAAWAVVIAQLAEAVLLLGAFRVVSGRPLRSCLLPTVEDYAFLKEGARALLRRRK